MRMLKLTVLLLIALAAIGLPGCGCTDDFITISAPKAPIQVGSPVQLKAVLESPNSDEKQDVTSKVDWSIAGNPEGASITKEGVFVAQKPGRYLVRTEYGQYADDVRLTVAEGAEPSGTPKPEDSFSVDTSAPGDAPSATGASGFAGTYKGMMQLMMGKQKTDVPFVIVVDPAGNVTGSFEHVWEPEGSLKATTKATFAGTIAVDGTISTKGTATSSGTNGGAPYRSSGNIEVGGKITGTQFVGGLSGSQDWVAEKQ